MQVDEDGLFADHGSYAEDSLTALRLKIQQMHRFFSGEMPGFTLDKALLNEANNNFLARAQTVTCWSLRLFQVDGALHRHYDHRLGQKRLARWLKQIWLAYDAHERWIREDRRELELRTAMHWVRQIGYMRVIAEHVGQLVESAHALSRLLFNPDDARVDTTRPVQLWMERNFIRQHNGEQAEEEQRRTSMVTRIVHHCLDRASRRGLRWRNGHVYEERKVEFLGGVYGTRTYQYLCWDAEEDLRDGRLSTIEEFVGRVCTKDEVYEFWEALLEGRVRNNVVTFLKSSREREFPQLKPRRNLLSFRNGIYDTEAPGRGAFFTHDNVPKYFKPSDVACKFFDVQVDAKHFFEDVSAYQGAWFDRVKTPLFQGILDYQNYGGNLTPEGRQHLDRLIDREQEAQVEAVSVTRRHLQAFLQATENAVLAATEVQRADQVHEALVSILENCDALKGNCRQVLEQLQPASQAAALAASTQAPQPAPPDLPGSAEAREACPPEEKPRARRLPPDVQKWVYIFLGRLLHDLGFKDNWQIVPFIKGVAGTGKSLIAQVAMHFFEPEDVGVMGSSIEPLFGLSALAEKFMYVCLEVKKNFSLDQSLFQSIVSGEQVSVAVKNRTAYTKQWTAPGILCGNEWASYKDSQGSIARRLAIINFPFPVSQRDTNPHLLKDILDKELPTLIMKCNTAYLEMTEIQRDAGIWKILPPYFEHQQKTLQIDSDPLMALLHDTTIFVSDPGAWIHWDVFHREYQRKCRELRGSDYHEPLIDDKICPALREFNAQPVRDSRPPYGTAGDAQAGRWIIGLRAINDPPSTSSLPSTSAPSRR